MSGQDGFTAMVDAAEAFFPQLAANNSRDWFEAHKAHYTAEIRKPAELLAQIMAEEISRRTGAPYTAKVFRIHRDVRFSRDKSPYNAHLHVLWQAPGADPLVPAVFFGLQPGWIGMLHGLAGLKGPALTRYRGFIDSHGDAVREALGDRALSDFGAEPLKRVPSPYPPDHPHADLLRRKSLIAEHPLEGWRKTGLVRALQQASDAMMPLHRLILAELQG